MLFGNDRGFTLIETSLAIALAAILVTAGFAMLPHANKAAQDAGDYTVLGLVMEDVRDRIEGQALVEGVPEISPLYYDLDGRPIDPDQEERSQDRHYRVDLELVKMAESQRPVDAEELLAARIEFSWPVDSQSGDALGDRNPRYETTFLVTTLTGPDWEAIDPDFQPRVEN